VVRSDQPRYYAGTPGVQIRVMDRRGAQEVEERVRLPSACILASHYVLYLRHGKLAVLATESLVDDQGWAISPEH
jgi:hypothetical protein